VEGRAIFASLRDPITLELINDPIAVSSGITYDRKSLQRWFESKRDPVTQEIPVTMACPITKFSIHRNELNNRTHVLIRGAIDHFVSKLEAEFKNPVRSNEGSAHVSSVGIFSHTQQLASGEGIVISHSNSSGSERGRPSPSSKE